MLRRQRFLIGLWISMSSNREADASITWVEGSHFADLLRPFRLGANFNENDPLTYYWSDGKCVRFGVDHVLKGADPETFVFFLNGFAKDKNYCYQSGKKLAGADPKYFECLSYAFCKDRQFVWSHYGKVKDVDALTFVACDDGIHVRSGHRNAYGFGKDSQRVFYSDGRGHWVRKADPATFKSLNDGHFGLDDRTVFFCRSSIPGAVAKTWKKLGGYYSRDDSRVFYLNRLIVTADANTFKVVNSKSGTQLARDNQHFYWNDGIVDYDLSQATIWAEDALISEQGDLPPVLARVPSGHPPLPMPPSERPVNTPTDTSIKCKCGLLPVVVQGKSSKLPCKYFDVVRSKPHPLLPGFSRCSILLVRCQVCGQFWQADQWSRNFGRTSWPDLCIKVDDPDNWESFDDHQLRLDYFPSMLYEVTKRKCTSPGCKDFCISEIDLCANCACKKLHENDVR